MKIEFEIKNVEGIGVCKLSAKLKTIIILLLFSISFIILFNNNSLAASGNGFAKFDNAPRYALILDDNKNLVVKIVDYSGINAENIHVFLNNRNGQELTVGNGLKSNKCIETREKNGKTKNVVYEYVIQKEFLKKYITKDKSSQTFYINVKDNFGNYTKSYFGIYVNGNDLTTYKGDPAPRIISFKANGNEMTFASRDLGGTNVLTIYDLNNLSKQASKTYNNLEKGNAQIKLDLSNFVKGDDGKYRLKIYAKDKNDPKYKGKQMAASRTIAFEVEEVDLKSISFEENNITIGKNQSKNLIIKKNPINATTSEKILYESSNKEIVTVNSKGKITGVKEGMATITAKTEKGLEAKCTIKVINEVSITNIEFKNNRIQLKPGETKALRVAITPSNATNKNLKFISSDEKIAKVDNNGVVTVLKIGSAKITAISNNGKRANCKIIVIANASSSTKPVPSSGNGYSQTITLNGKTFNLYGQARGTYAGGTYRGNSMANNGCGPTAATIILSGYGYKGNPHDFASNCKESQYIASSAENLGLGVKAKVYNYNSSNVNRIKSDIINILQKGHQIGFDFGRDHMASGDNLWSKYSGCGYHWIAVLAYDAKTEQVFIGNPNSGKYTGWTSIQDLVRLAGNGTDHFIEFYE